MAPARVVLTMRLGRTTGRRRACSIPAARSWHPSTSCRGRWSQMTSPNTADQRPGRPRSRRRGRLARSRLQATSARMGGAAHRRRGLRLRQAQQLGQAVSTAPCAECLSRRGWPARGSGSAFVGAGEALNKQARDRQAQTHRREFEPLVVVGAEAAVGQARARAASCEKGGRGCCSASDGLHVGPGSPALEPPVFDQQEDRAMISTSLS
jgi:hypothetical protein